MSILPVLLLLISVGFSLNQEVDEYPPLLCGGTFCPTYLQDNKCIKVPDNCKIQNATHNGLEVPSAVPCNCCAHCLANIPEGGYCSPGALGDPVPDSICGPGLYCDADKTCKKMSEIDDSLPVSDCSKGQKQYDAKKQDGTLGHMEVRPVCDDSGDYVPYKCVPGQTCHCVDKAGKRIYGEILDGGLVPKLMHCECSRRYEEAVLVIGRDLNPIQHFRCAPNGDYDSLQCIGEECLCVDSQDGVPTYPQNPSLNMSLIQNKTLFPCYDENYHENVGYFRPCALTYVESLNEVAELAQEKGFDWVLNYDFPDCDLDQNFGPVQVSSEESYCSDLLGAKIEDFGVPLNDPALKEMDCKCARTRSLIGSAKIEKPECCPNGNFKKIQCRRGLCRCVDRDGHQTEKEVPKDQLDKLTSCNEATSCDFP